MAVAAPFQLDLVSASVDTTFAYGWPKICRSRSVPSQPCIVCCTQAIAIVGFVAPRFRASSATLGVISQRVAVCFEFLVVLVAIALPVMFSVAPIDRAGLDVRQVHTLSMGCGYPTVKSIFRQRVPRAKTVFPTVAVQAVVIQGLSGPQIRFPDTKVCWPIGDA